MGEVVGSNRHLIMMWSMGKGRIHIQCMMMCRVQTTTTTTTTTATTTSAHHMLLHKMVMVRPGWVMVNAVVGIGGGNWVNRFI